MKKIIIYIILLVIVLISSYTIINIRNKKLNDVEVLEETTIVVTGITIQFPASETKIETTVNSVVPTLSPEEEAYWESRRLEDEEFDKEHFVSEESILEMAKPAPNWDKVDIVEEKKRILKENYPNGILRGEEYDDIYIDGGYEQLIPNGTSTIYEFYLIATKGLKKDKYRITGSSFGTFMSKEDFEIGFVDKFEKTDKDGNPVNSGHSMNEKNYLGFLMRLSFSDDEEMGKSERFKIEHPSFTGILNPYNFQHTNNSDVKWDEKNSSYEDKIAYCRVHYLEYCEDYDFAITWTVDEKGFLDTYDVKTLRKREHYNGKNDNFDNPFSLNVTKRILFKNRSWRRLPLTKEFKQKFNSKDGIYDKEIVWIIRGYFNHKYEDKKVYQVKLKDNSIVFIGLKYYIVDNKINDINVTELSIDKIDENALDEIYQMF